MGSDGFATPRSTVIDSELTSVNYASPSKTSEKKDPYEVTLEPEDDPHAPGSTSARAEALLTARYTYR